MIGDRSRALPPAIPSEQHGSQPAAGPPAAAFGLPFLPTRVGLGTDLAELGGLKTVTSPYADGETLIAMPALKLDAALIHVNRSDWRGNVQVFGPDVYYDE
ncbi:MAG: hypothetical protein RLZZ11_714, partial [Cyanobacteriota bacterium]